MQLKKTHAVMKMPLFCKILQKKAKYWSKSTQMAIAWLRHGTSRPVYLGDEDCGELLQIELAYLRGRTHYDVITTKECYQQWTSRSELKGTN